MPLLIAGLAGLVVLGILAVAFKPLKNWGTTSSRRDMIADLTLLGLAQMIFFAPVLTVWQLG